MRNRSRAAVIVIAVVISAAVAIYGGMFSLALIGDAFSEGFGIMGILGITALLVTVGLIWGLIKVARESLREIKERDEDDDLSKY